MRAICADVSLGNVCSMFCMGRAGTAAVGAVMKILEIDSGVQ
jgi:hypothetical protein